MAASIPRFSSAIIGDPMQIGRYGMSSKVGRRIVLILIMCGVSAVSVLAQGLTSGTVTGTVTDPNGAVVPNATVVLENAVTGYNRSMTTGIDGAFRFDNVPFNNYVYSASAAGFAGVRGNINIRTSVPITLAIPLAVGETTAVVTVRGVPQAASAAAAPR